ncbi:MAG: Sua5/YciO/YrdC/YwlC family protein [Planctomycetota bacterium]
MRLKAWQNMPVLRIKVKGEAFADADVERAVAAIRSGALVALPTETVYGLAADPDDAASVAKLQRAKGRDAGKPLTHHVASVDAARRLVAAIPRRVERLAARFWPGPFTAVLPTPEGGSIGVRVPAQAFTRAVLAHFPRGLLLSSVNPSGAPPLTDPDEIAARFTDIDVLIDAGPAVLGTASAVVRDLGVELEVLREGTLARDELLRAAAATVWFVCTGNTCRSPLAAAIATHAAAGALGVGTGDLLARGLHICSAGTATGGGSIASEGSLQVAAEIGLDLGAHVSRPAEPTDLARAAAVYAMTQSHLRHVLGLAPDVASRAQVLDPDGTDIPDPFGGDLSIYREAREVIGQAVMARLPAILALM